MQIHRCGRTQPCALIERLESRWCLSTAFGVDDLPVTVDTPGWRPVSMVPQGDSLGDRAASDGSFVLSMTGPGSGIGRATLQSDRLAISLLKFQNGAPMSGTAQSLADGAVAVSSQLRLADGTSRGTPTLYTIPHDRSSPETAYLFDAQAPTWSIQGPFKRDSGSAAGQVRYNLTITDSESFFASAQVTGLVINGPNGQITLSTAATYRNPGQFYSQIIYSLDAQLPVDGGGHVVSGTYTLAGTVNATDLAGNTLSQTLNNAIGSGTGAVWSQPTPDPSAPTPGFTVRAIRAPGAAYFVNPDGTTILTNSWGTPSTPEQRAGWQIISLAALNPTPLNAGLAADETLSKVQWFTDGSSLFTTNQSRRLLFSSGFSSVSIIQKPSGATDNWDVVVSDDGALLLAASDANNPLSFPQLPELRRLWIAPRNGSFTEVALADDPVADPDAGSRGILSRDLQHEPAANGSIPTGFATDGGAASAAEAIVSLLYHKQLRAIRNAATDTYDISLRSNDGMKHAVLSVSGSTYSLSRPTLIITDNTVAVPSQSPAKILGKANWMTWLPDGSYITSTFAFVSGQVVASFFHVTALGTRPVVFLPGIVGSWPRPGTYNTWLMNMGSAPSSLEVEPLARTYKDLIQSLEAHGYTEGTDLFLAPYDWRLPWVPSDGVADGHMTGFNADSLVDGQFQYGVDYIGDALSRAMSAWNTAHQHPLDAVDLITHSTGGLVARAYIQSDAYGGALASGTHLPIIDEFVAMAAPHEGASKAWNLFNDNYIADPVYQMIFSNVVFDAFNRLFTKSSRYPEITRPLGGSITESMVRDRADLPQYAQLKLVHNSDGEPQMALVAAFMDLFVPGGASLTATYDFIFADGSPGAWTQAASSALQFKNLNSDPARRNAVLLDINAGESLRFNTATLEWDTFDSYDETHKTWRYSVGNRTGSGDMNIFANRARTTVIASVDVLTLSVSRALVGPKTRAGLAPSPTDEGPYPRPIYTAGDHARQPADGELWFIDLFTSAPDSSGSGFFPEAGYVALQRSLFFLDELRMPMGDGTVPGVSSVNPFVHDQRAALFALTENADHGELMANTDAQSVALRMLGATVDRARISTGSQTKSLRTLKEFIALLMDPVQAVVTDPQGRRLGWTQGTGSLSEIPNSMYFGDSEGIGFIFSFDDTPAPLNLAITSLDGSPNVRVSTLRSGRNLETVVFDDPLPAGQTRTVALTTSGTSQPPTILASATLTNGLKAKPFTITFEDLLLKTQAADPDATSVRFRIDSVLAGSLRRNGAPVTPGSTTLAPGESLVWTPPTKITGLTAAFSLSAVSAGDASANTCTVSINIRASSAKPVFQKVPIQLGADAGIAYTFNVPALLALASDPDHDPLFFTITKGPKAGSLTLDGAPVIPGVTRLSSTAALVFTPSSSQSKDVEVFSLAANDGTAASSAASVKLRINAAPTLAAPKDIKGASAGIPFAISFNLLSQAAKATDPNKDTIQYRIDSIASGSLLLNNAPVEPGALVAPGSTLSWTPPNTINGRTLAFSVSAFDGRLYSASRPLYFLTDGLPKLTAVTPILVSSGSSSISYTQLAAAANESGPPGLEIAFRVQSIANGFSLTVNDAPVVAGTLIHAGDTIQFVVPSAMRGKKDLMQIVAWNGSFASAKPVAVKIDIR